jgi:pSer/pThr/pTyr-binding forkhead associated (FHA) protein
VSKKLQIMIMSGVQDGTLLSFSEGRDGRAEDDLWTLSIGRREDNDICLRNDTFVSRQHANIHWKHNQVVLEDCRSTNGTFAENPEDYFADERVTGTIALSNGQLFRIGRTWLRLQVAE